MLSCDSLWYLLIYFSVCFGRVVILIVVGFILGSLYTVIMVHIDVFLILFWYNGKLYTVIPSRVVILIVVEFILGNLYSATVVFIAFLYLHLWYI